MLTLSTEYSFITIYYEDWVYQRKFLILC
jgi:hypothetical protein